MLISALANKINLVPAALYCDAVMVDYSPTKEINFIVLLKMKQTYKYEFMKLNFPKKKWFKYLY